MEIEVSGIYCGKFYYEIMDKDVRRIVGYKEMNSFIKKIRKKKIKINYAHQLLEECNGLMELINKFEFKSKSKK